MDNPFSAHRTALQYRRGFTVYDPFFALWINKRLKEKN